MKRFLLVWIASLAAMASYVDLIVQHFNQNITNPVIIYNPSGSGTTLQKLDELLTVNKGKSMRGRFRDADRRWYLFDWRHRDRTVMIVTRPGLSGPCQAVRETLTIA